MGGVIQITQSNPKCRSSLSSAFSPLQLPSHLRMCTLRFPLSPISIKRSPPSPTSTKRSLRSPTFTSSPTLPTLLVPSGLGCASTTLDRVLPVDRTEHEIEIYEYEE